MLPQNDINRAAQIIKEGGLVAFPTETVYGLGADAFNPEAVANIFATKQRPNFDPLIVHIADIKSLDKLCAEVDERVKKLADAFWPGPLTIVLPKSEHVPAIVTSGLPTVAVRMPSHPLALELIRQSGTSIAAPSANKFGMLSPTEAQHVKKQLPNVQCILDGGKTNIGLESTVVALNDDGFEILRPGYVTATDLLKHLPQSSFRKQHTEMHAPGMLKSHYSPRKPLYIKDDMPEGLYLKNAGYISFGKPDGNNPYQSIEVLSAEKSLHEAAINLFSALHKLEDNADVDLIIAENVPEEGIGLAIMDRLRKAAWQYKGKQVFKRTR